MKPTYEELVEILRRIAEFDPQEEYNEPVDEWVEARAFTDVRLIARAAMDKVDGRETELDRTT